MPREATPAAGGIRGEIQPTGFPILIDPALVEQLVTYRTTVRDRGEQMRDLMAQIEALQKQVAALHDESQHAETGIRIALRGLIAEHSLPDTTGINIDTEAGTVTLVDRPAATPRVRG